VHELSVALSLVDLACEAATRLAVPRIDVVHVTIGPLAGIVADALRFSFDLAAAGTPVEGAELRIEDAPLIAFCAVCAEEKAIASPQHLRCPTCGATTPDVRSGRDLQLVAVEVPDVADSGDSPEHSQEERPAGR
jgi:hydrogenase nickel incorporation protein HypA/HybF